MVDPIRIELSRKDTYLPNNQEIDEASTTQDTQGGTLGAISISEVREFLSGLLRLELRHQISALQLIIGHTHGSAWSAARMYISTLLADDKTEPSQ